MDTKEFSRNDDNSNGKNDEESGHNDEIESLKRLSLVVLNLARINLLPQ